MKYRRAYLDLNELGRLFGVSGRVVGSCLKKLGLRDRWRNPTRQAESQGLVERDYERHGTYTKLWHVERTIRILEDSGLELAHPAPSDLIEPPKLSGPFTVYEFEKDQWQLVNSDGDVAVLLVGEQNARAVQRVMNVAYRAEMLDRILAHTA